MLETKGMVGEATRAHQARPDAASSCRALWVGRRPLQHPGRQHQAGMYETEAADALKWAYRLA
jgi:hypothetical protein